MNTQKRSKCNSTITYAAAHKPRIGKLIIGLVGAGIGLLLPCITNAQLLGPAPGGLSNYYTDNGIMTLNSYAARTSIGACWGGANSLNGDGYLGFNFAYDGNSSQPWTYRGGGEGGVIYLNGTGDMMFAARSSVGGNGGSISNNDVKNITRMRIANNGKVSIGSSFFGQTNQSTPGNYKLYVEDGILTERVRVAVRASGDWADYVFNKDYKLMPLARLKEYVAVNNHLPDVPSANEVVNKGVDLQQMDATLLKKVEELTLYMLQQQQQIDELAKAHHKKR